MSSEAFLRQYMNNYLVTSMPEWDLIMTPGQAASVTLALARSTKSDGLLEQHKYILCHQAKSHQVSW